MELALALVLSVWHRTLALRIITDQGFRGASLTRAPDTQTKQRVTSTLGCSLAGRLQATPAPQFQVPLRSWPAVAGQTAATAPLERLGGHLRCVIVSGDPTCRRSLYAVGPGRRSGSPKPRQRDASPLRPCFACVVCTPGRGDRLWAWLLEKESVQGRC